VIALAGQRADGGGHGEPGLQPGPAAEGRHRHGQGGGLRAPSHRPHGLPREGHEPRCPHRRCCIFRAGGLLCCMAGSGFSHQRTPAPSAFSGTSVLTRSFQKRVKRVKRAVRKLCLPFCSPGRHARITFMCWELTLGGATQQHPACHRRRHGSGAWQPVCTDLHQTLQLVLGVKAGLRGGRARHKGGAQLADPHLPGNSMQVSKERMRCWLTFWKCPPYKA
jgi:hypothetical protein